MNKTVFKLIAYRVIASGFYCCELYQDDHYGDSNHSEVLVHHFLSTKGVDAAIGNAIMHLAIEWHHSPIAIRPFLLPPQSQERIPNFLTRSALPA